jgi:hypothetical protein
MNILIPLRKNYRRDINGDHRLSSLNTHMQARNKAINMAPKVVSNVSSGISLSPVGVEARKTHSGPSFSAFYDKAGAETPSVDLPVDHE